MNDPRLEAIEEFHRDRWLAHTVLFRHRHPDESAPAHKYLVEEINRPVARLNIEGFRGLAKSTYLEETVVLKACYREFHNLVIGAASFTRAVERLAAIKNEFLINEPLIELFGELRGPTWQEGKIVLSTGICIQAVGRDQAMTGMKHLEWRPDAFLIDDVEDPEEIRSDVEREATWRWLLRTFIPSLDRPTSSWGRFLGTRRGVGSLPERLENAGVATIKIPIETVGAASERVASWPAKFSLAEIDRLKNLYRGRMDLYVQEYMCEATSETARPFSRESLRCEPRPRSWEAVYAMYDPARTAGRQSATTGIAAWSWLRNRLVFWHLKAEIWLPDQIIADMFELHRRFELTWLGFEEDGLNEWARQPIRAEMLRRGVTLPLRPIKAPRGKIQFIQGLQPFARAGEVSFAGPPEVFSDALDQFASFPYGKIDAPNAAAYALLLRPGAPVFDNFTEQNIAEDLEPVAGKPLFLAANADGSILTAILAQRAEGELRVFADWVREGNPLELVGDIHAEAALLIETGRFEERVIYGEGADEYKLPIRVQGWQRLPLRWIVPAWHRDNYRNVGLVQAIRAIPQGVGTADNDGGAGRVALARLLLEQYRGRPKVLVSPQARWTLRAFMGGYTKEVAKSGLLAAEPEPGIYRVLMEGLEAFAAVGQRVDHDGGEDQQPVAYNRDGVAYRSAMPMRAR